MKDNMLGLFISGLIFTGVVVGVVGLLFLLVGIVLTVRGG